MNEEKQLHKERSRRIPYWFKVVIVFFFGWVVLYAARQILSPLMGEVQLEFGLNKKTTRPHHECFLLSLCRVTNSFRYTRG